MTSSRHAGLLTGLAAGVVTLSGCEMMLPPDQNPLYIRQSEMDNRLTRVEQQVDNEGLVTLLSKLDALEQDVRILRNNVETLQHEVEQANGRQRELYLDLDQRLQAIEQVAARSGPAAAAAGAAGSAQLPVPGGTDRDNYQAAFDLLKRGQYDDAAVALEQFMVAFPASELSDNAQYWLAETRYVSQNYSEALTEFQVLLERFPDSGKRPDALLKIGFCNYELENWAKSRAALSAVSEDHPETTAARLANQRLDRMSNEGH